MTGPEVIDDRFATRFVDAVHDCFLNSAILNERMCWVGGRVREPHDAVILYRDRPDGPVLGRRYELRSYSALFGGETAQWLANEAWLSDITDPSGAGEPKDVDWAVGLVDDPGVVRWLD